MRLKKLPALGTMYLGVKHVLKHKTYIGIWEGNRRTLLVFIFLILGSFVFSCAYQYR